MLTRLRFDHAGAVAIILTISLVVLLGFAALGYEAGTWYVIKDELAKAVDIGALTAAANVSSPYVNLKTISIDFAKQNYCPGLSGRSAQGQEADVQYYFPDPVGNAQFRLAGKVQGATFLTKLFGLDHVEIGSQAAAGKEKVEIMLALDRSGTMGSPKSNPPLPKLVDAAKGFVDSFAQTEDQDRMGLITFDQAAAVMVGLKNDFSSSILAEIGKIKPVSDIGSNSPSQTNTEEAIDLALPGSPGSFPDQRGLPYAQQVWQFLVIFSDGLPDCLTDNFLYQGVTTKGVLCTYYSFSAVPDKCPFDCPPYPQSIPAGWDTSTWKVRKYLDDPSAKGQGLMRPLTIPVWPVGDGVSKCGTTKDSPYSVKWDGLTPGSPLPNCCETPRVLAQEACYLARSMAEENARKLKTDYEVEIYTVCLISDYAKKKNCEWMRRLASDNNHAFETSDPNQLVSLFSQVAEQIKLRLTWRLVE